MKTVKLITLLYLFLVGIANAADNQLNLEEKAQQWQLLFDGKDLAKNWKNFGQNSLSDKWKIENGSFGITEDAGDIITKQAYENFEFKIDWKISEKGNSGIFFRIDETGERVASHAMEVQILDDKNFRDKKGDSAGPKHLTGSIYDLIAAKPGLFKGHGTWNTTHIIAIDNKVSSFLNGVLVAEIDKNSDEYTKVFLESKFSRNKKRAPLYAKVKKGPIGLQDHHSEVWFKNAKVRPL